MALNLTGNMENYLETGSRCLPYLYFLVLHPHSGRGEGRMERGEADSAEGGEGAWKMGRHYGDERKNKEQKEEVCSGWKTGSKGRGVDGKWGWNKEKAS